MSEGFDYNDKKERQTSIAGQDDSSQTQLPVDEQPPETDNQLPSEESQLPVDEQPPESVPQKGYPNQQPTQQNFTTLEQVSEGKIESQGEAFTREQGILDAKTPPKPKSWQEDKRIAIAIGIIGFIVLGIVFYFLFHSVGVI